MMRRDGQEGCDFTNEDGRRCYKVAESKCLHGSFCGIHNRWHGGYRGKGVWAAPCEGYRRVGA